MKKILMSLIVSALLVTPAMAQQGRDRHDNSDRYNQSRQNDNHRHNNKRSGCGWLCGAIIGGVVIATILPRQNRQPAEDRDDNRYYPPNYRYDSRDCVREQIVEWRGNERYVYWQTICN
jgi:Ni/Co efflux regulator RcnB